MLEPVARDLSLSGHCPRDKMPTTSQFGAVSRLDLFVRYRTESIRSRNCYSIWSYSRSCCLQVPLVKAFCANTPSVGMASYSAKETDRISHFWLESGPVEASLCHL